MTTLKQLNEVKEDPKKILNMYRSALEDIEDEFSAFETQINTFLRTRDIPNDAAALEPKHVKILVQNMSVIKDIDSKLKAISKLTPKLKLRI